MCLCVECLLRNRGQPYWYRASITSGVEAEKWERYMAALTTVGISITERVPSSQQMALSGLGRVAWISCVLNRERIKIKFKS